MGAGDQAEVLVYRWQILFSVSPQPAQSFSFVYEFQPGALRRNFKIRSIILILKASSSPWIESWLFTGVLSPTSTGMRTLSIGELSSITSVEVSLSSWLCLVSCVTKTTLSSWALPGDLDFGTLCDLGVGGREHFSVCV